jgi:F0F1-type ATP synthase assembly protein I
MQNMKFRITIRDLFWLVLVVALAIGWWLDHRKLTKPTGMPKMGVPLREPIG